MPSPRRTALTPAPRAPAALVTASLASIEHAIGGREALVAALLHAPKTKDVEYVVGLLGDPMRKGDSLAVLCVAGGITPGELLAAYKAGEINRAQALSAYEVGKALPEVVRDTMRLAATYEDDCLACQGLGQVTPEPTSEQPNPEPVDCPQCQGGGRLRYDGDLEHKKLALGLGKLLEKGGGINLQVNQQQNSFHGGVAGGALEAMQAATDRVLYGDGVIEVEAVPVPPAEPPV